MDQLTKETAIPFDDLAKLNQDGSMTKLIALPFLVIFGLAALIVVIRFFQKLRDRSSLGRYMDD